MFLDSNTHAEAVRLIEAAEEYVTCEWVPQLRRELMQRYGYGEDQVVDHDAYAAALEVFQGLLHAKQKLKTVERCASE